MQSTETEVGGLLAIDGERIVSASAGFTAITGWTTRDLAGLSVFDKIHPADECEARQRTAAFVQHGIPTHGTINRWEAKGGGWVTLSWSPVELDGTIYAHCLPVPTWLVGAVTPGGDTVINLPETEMADDDEGTGMDDAARIAQLEGEVARLRGLLAQARSAALGCAAVLTEAAQGLGVPDLTVEGE